MALQLTLLLSNSIQFNLFFFSSQVWRENSFLTALCWPPRLFLQIAIISLFSCFRPSLSFATPLVALVSPICALNRESYNVQKFGLCHFAPLHISVYPLIFALLEIFQKGGSGVCIEV